MHPKVITKRNKAAEQRLVEAISKMAGITGVEHVLPASSRDSDLRAVFTLESLADTAEAILTQLESPAAQAEPNDEDKPKRGRKAKE